MKEQRYIASYWDPEMGRHWYIPFLSSPDVIMAPENVPKRWRLRLIADASGEPVWRWKGERNEHGH